MLPATHRPRTARWWTALSSSVVLTGAGLLCAPATAADTASARTHQARAATATPRPVAPSVQQQPLTGVDPAAAAELALPAEAAGLQAASADEHAHAPGTTVALTPRTTAPRFTLVAASWDQAADTSVRTVSVRVRENGTWTTWYDLTPETQDAPDAGTADAQGSRGGSAPLLTSGADAYQIKVDSSTGSAPAGLRVDTLDAGTSPADATMPSQQATEAQAETASVASGTVTRPPIISRAQWGADESLRSGEPTYMGRLKVGVVHHTESTNSYDPAGAAAQVRGIYAFHTQVRGWSDVGYNFLVDRFGRVYEGRYGGVDRAVMGAHAGGYNSDTFGASVLGSHMQTSAPPAVLRGLTRLFAWKYATNNIDPYGSSQLTSAGGGTAHYPAGDTRAFGNLLGHRDTGSTDCPGNALYPQLPALRAAVQSAMLKAGAPAGTTSAGSTLRPGATLSDTRYLVSPNGQHILSATGYAGEQYGLTLSGLSCEPIVMNKLGRPDSGSWSPTLAMQSDGNLVPYSGGQAVWASGTNNNPGAYVSVQNDRNVVVYSSTGRPLWWSGYGCSTAVGSIERGAELRANQTMSNGPYTLAMQGDGNFVLYVGQRPIWQAGTGGNPGARAAVQWDGNVVVYSSAGRPLWWSGSGGDQLRAKLAVQGDGNVVLYRGEGDAGMRPGWSTGTGGVR